MKIHSIKKGESIKAVAEKYEISEERIRENNSGVPSMPCEGRELLILRPTRTYTARTGDSVSAVAHRFGIKPQMLALNNPSIIESDICAGKELAVKYPLPHFGTAAANGYLYSGAPLSALKRAMPYITYLTVGEYRLSGGELIRLFNAKDAVAAAKAAGKVVLMRVYDGGNGESYATAEKRSLLTSALVSAAKSGEYCGITLSSHNSAVNFAAEFSEFLMTLRKKMIGCDLVLFTETDEALSPDVAELADGSVFIYGKQSCKNPPSFNDGERRVLTDFAKHAESSKAMVYVSSEAYTGGGYIPRGVALELAERSGGIKTDADALLSRFTFKGQAVVFDSLENTKAKLELISELGFNGAAFDIGTAPTEYLMMFSSMFSPVHYQLPYSFPI